MNYYPTFKKIAVPLLDTTKMCLEAIMLGERNEIQKEQYHMASLIWRSYKS